MEVIARLAADESLGDRVMKVNHAGEQGAVNIYRAQLLGCRWRNSDITSELNSSWTSKCDTAKYSRLNSYAAVDLNEYCGICRELRNCRTSPEMIQRFYGSHLETEMNVDRLYQYKEPSGSLEEFFA